MRSGAAVADALEVAGSTVTRLEVNGFDFKLPRDVDVVFIALHGTFGEDGTVQRLLEKRGVPYTFSGPDASEKAFDKTLSKQAFEAAGIPTPRAVVIKRQRREFTPLQELRWPLIIKPARQGSSMGIAIVRQPSELKHACIAAGKYDDLLLAEEYIKGRELTVAILDERALPVIEVKPKHQFFDYQSKYTAGETEYLVPAPLDGPLRDRVADLALRAHQCLGCRDLSRVDIMLAADGALYVLEVNTIPGFTATSLVPKAAKSEGMSFPRLCSHLVRNALARKTEKAKTQTTRNEAAATPRPTQSAVGQAGQRAVLNTEH